MSLEKKEEEMKGYLGGREERNGRDGRSCRRSSTTPALANGLSSHHCYSLSHREGVSRFKIFQLFLKD